MKFWIFSTDFLKCPQISNFMKIRPVGTEFLRTERLSLRNQYHFSQFWGKAPNKKKIFVRRLSVGDLPLAAKRFVVFSWRFVQSCRIKMLPKTGLVSWKSFCFQATRSSIQTKYRGADKSLARPGRKQANVSFRMAWISFGAWPCRKRNLMTARVSMSLKSRASLTCFWACSIPGRAKELITSPVKLQQYFPYYLTDFCEKRNRSWGAPHHTVETLWVPWNSKEWNS